VKCRRHFTVTGGDLSDIKLSGFAPEPDSQHLSDNAPTCTVLGVQRKPPAVIATCRAVRLAAPAVAFNHTCGAEHRERQDRLRVRSSFLDDCAHRGRPDEGLAARSVVIVGPDGKVKYTELVPRSPKPDYSQPSPPSTEL
jgi:thiol peroxidase